jgi:2-iminobutanoate/2-iminopropanoate deaminase
MCAQSAVSRLKWSVSEQSRQAFANLDAVLRAGGSRPELVVSTTVLVADQASFPELNELYAEFFPTEPPVPQKPTVDAELRETSAKSSG